MVMSPRLKRLKRTNPEPYSLPTQAGDISYVLVRSTRRRTIAISIGSTAQVRVAAPRYAPDKEIRSFIVEKAPWIQKKLIEARHVQEILRKRQYIYGNEFLFLGEKYPLKVEGEDIRQSRIAFDGRRWCVRVHHAVEGRKRQDLVKNKLVQWYRIQAKEIFGGRIFHYARQMGLEPQTIAVKTQKRIWGSCAHKEKAISLNWQLVLSPMAVIDYVVVHEMCHLIVPNHSRRFWQKVGKVLPDYKDRQKWLKKNQLDMVLP